MKICRTAREWLRALGPALLIIVLVAMVLYLSRYWTLPS